MNLPEKFSSSRSTIAIIVGVIAVICLAISPKLVESIDADEFTVIQSPTTGKLDWYVDPGPVWQGFGEVTAYKQRATYEFKKKIGPDGKPYGGIPLRFNDGSHGTIYGSIQFSLPKDTTKLTDLHRRYKSMDQVTSQILQPVTNNAVYLVGTMMSAKESYAEKRPDLLHFVLDQVQNGVYRTLQKKEWVTDPVTKERKEIITAELMLDADGKPMRQEASVLNSYGITSYNFLMDTLDYDNAVEKQIEQQRQITMDIQTSLAEKLKAEQRAQTAESQGRANATEAKWEAEKTKATAVVNAEREKEVAVTKANQERIVAETGAQQRLNVAEFDRQSAEKTKLSNILEGEGLAAKKKLILEADGALEQKLKAYTEVTPKIFEALRGTAFVPQISMGAAAGSNTAMPLVEMLTAKVARDLAVDLGMGPKSAPAPGK